MVEKIFNAFMCLGFVYFMIALYPGTNLRGYAMVLAIVMTGHYFIEWVKGWIP